MNELAVYIKYIGPAHTYLNFCVHPKYTRSKFCLFQILGIEIVDGVLLYLRIRIISDGKLMNDQLLLNRSFVYLP